MHDQEYSLAQLIDVERLQRTLQDLSRATGIGLAVLDPDGAVLVGSGCQDICTRLHRVDQVTAAGYRESDRRINERIAAGIEGPTHIAYKCANGLWDVAFPLIIDARHVATVFIGQFLFDDDVVDREAFIERARERGLDEDGYLEALSRVPVRSREQIELTIGFVADIVGMLSESGLSALRERESRAELQRSQGLLRAVLDAIPARVFWKDADLRYLGANVPFARDAGFASPTELLGKDDFAMGWKEQAELYRADDRAVIAAGQAKLNIEEPQTTPDGRSLTLLTSKVPLRDDAGDVIGVLGTYLDITDRKQAQQRLRESQELLDYIIRHDQSGVAVFDNEMRYVFVSDRYLEDFGLGDRDVIGVSCYDVFPEMRDRFEDVHRRVLAGAVERAEEDAIPRADGTVDWVCWECRPWRRGDGYVGGLVLYSELITERREEQRNCAAASASTRRSSTRRTTWRSSRTTGSAT